MTGIHMSGMSDEPVPKSMPIKTPESIKKFTRPKLEPKFSFFVSCVVTI
jgi:hypothetical protein